MMQIRVLGGVSAAAIFLFLTACGGGGGGTAGGTPIVVSTPTPSTKPTATPTPTPTPIPTSGATTIAVSARATSAPLPAVAGFSESMQLPAATSSVTLQAGVSTNPPTGVRAVQVRKRSAQTPNTPYLYFSLLSPTTTIDLNGVLGLTVTLPASVSPQQSFYLAELSSDGTWGTIAGPASATNGSVTLAAPAMPYYLPANTPLALAFYAGSPVYNGAPIATQPASVTLMDLKATQTLTIGGADPNATYTLDPSQCKGIATATQVDATTYTVAAVALGTCNLVIADNHGNSLAVFVTVTTTGVIVQ